MPTSYASTITFAFQARAGDLGSKSAPGSGFVFAFWVSVTAGLCMHSRDLMQLLHTCNFLSRSGGNLAQMGSR